MEAAAREHIEEIRRKKFSIGGEQNPLTEDLHQAVKNLSAELYAKDVHFLMELIQNAEDNDYLEGNDPSLEFVITSEDITNTMATATLLIFNNEKGFSPKNIDSICSIGRSTKKGNRKRGYIGEKGIGFKSVFLVSSQPYIFSNGYQIRFNEEPCPHCNLGYIVPEWVEENPTLSDIKKIYGSRTTLPTTTIVLPLKFDKIKPVKQQLSNIHPEVLLFLSKIRQLSVREHNNDPMLNTVSAIAITSETEFVVRKNIDAVSYTIHLSADEKGKEFEGECRYFMWRQKFPVRQENKVERRMEVEELVITLAFPFEERLHRGMSSPGIYAFLPTEMFTNFPFIIQADFLLASSRETILLDNKWNQGILDCVPSAFINAFVSLDKNSENAPVSSLASMFRFIPIDSSSYQTLNVVRESIKSKLLEESILPSESYTPQKIFHKPREVGRLMPAFWIILEKAREQKVSLFHLSSQGKYILSSSFDRADYDNILNFLGVELVNNEWYAKCIQSSKLVEGVSDDVYLELLLFIADNWRSKFDSTDMKYIPLIKYVGLYGDVSLCSINESMHSNRDKVVSLSRHPDHISWLIDWNKEFKCPANYFFWPKSTQEAIQFFSKRETVLEWLRDHVKVGAMSVKEYAVHLNNYLNSCQKRAIAFVHFLYHSLEKSFLSDKEVRVLCDSMPLVDNYGNLQSERTGVLVPANGSKWVGLIGSNPWTNEGYIELAEDYLKPDYFAGEYASRERFLEFLKTNVAASDIPDISPPNAAIPTVSSPLTKKNAFLLLGWIRKMKLREIYIPENFLKCIKEGSWLKITTIGCPGCRPPSESFMLSSSLGNILQNGSVLVDIPLIDLSFYGDEINEYEEELKKIGVMSEYGEACEFIGKRLMSFTEYSTLSRDQVLSILNFIRFLREKFLPQDKFINSIKDKRWLKTSCGVRSPVESVLFDEEWKTAEQISSIPFIDQHYFGEEILSYGEELESLGVAIGFIDPYKLVVDNLKLPPSSSLTAEAVLLILECMRCLGSSNKLVQALSGVRCFKTNLGYKPPGECFLFDPQWVCILQVFEGFALIDHDFYGSSIFSYKNELKQTGVKVDFEEAVKVFADRFKQDASSMTNELVLSFLSCHRELKDNACVLRNSKKSYLSQREVGVLCDSMPLVDNYWNLKTHRKGVLVPANGSKWVRLIGSNPWTNEGYVELAEDYLQPGCFAGEYASGERLLEFLKTHVGPSDIPYISPPNATIPTVSSPLTKQNAFLLLGWIRNLKCREIYIPEKFLKCIKEGSWLKVTTSGCPGYRPPSQSFMLSSTLGNILQNGSVLVDIPLLDIRFYGDGINEYKEELKKIGVMSEYVEACKFIGERLMSFKYSNLTMSVLNFIRFLRKSFLPLDEFINSIRDKRWLRTCCGDRSPVESVLLDDEWKTASQISNIPFIDKDGEEILSFREELKLLGVVIGFSDHYQLVVDNLKSPSRLTSLTREAVLLILECMRRLGSSNKLVEALRGVKSFKTNLGYKSPGECFLFDRQWVCILQVFKVFPIIDSGFYGSSIFSYRNELKQAGVKVDFEVAANEFARRFREQASSMTDENVLSFLSCYRQLKDTDHKFPSDLKKCICEVKWLRTTLGIRKSPSECILSGPDWLSISPITVLPFIRDTDNYYGKGIHEYKKELKSMGVVVEFKDGVEFVVAGLHFPSDYTLITPANVFSLLKCFQILLQDISYSFPDDFSKRICKKWLKTTEGYQPPDKCLLFDSSWGTYLERTDGPFIDEYFYGPNITSYKKELKAIGVTVDVEKGCSLIASHLDSHIQFSRIVRIYYYLSQFNWVPDSEVAKWIWIPKGSQYGEWLRPEECVLHDKDGLFSTQLKALDKYYKPNLLDYFYHAFCVRCNPSVDDYCTLWEAWESSGHQLSYADCLKFWVYVSKHWSAKTERTLTDKLLKLPVASSSDEILLFNKNDVFIADDLQLKGLFEQFSPQPVFVWYPQPSVASLPQIQLFDIYRKIGVSTISESVVKEELSSVDVEKLHQVNPKEILITKDLVTLILGFLANPVMKMEAERRHETIRRLLNITFLETVEPITVNYSLLLSSGETVKARANRMIRWDREASKFFSQKLDRSSGYKNLIEYATYFSEAISEGVLWENTERIGALSELIKLAFMLEFNEEAVRFLMKSKNLQIFLEDEGFLASVFPSD